MPRRDDWRDDAERAAIELAQARFRRWRCMTPAFADLRRGTRALLAALTCLDDPQAPEVPMLLALMQAQPPHMPQATVIDELLRLRATLARIDAATTPVPGIRDDDAANYIAHAADAWVELTGTLPSSGDRSRFLLAIERHKADDIPTVTRDALRAVLPRWRAYHGLPD